MVVHQLQHTVRLNLPPLSRLLQDAVDYPSCIIAAKLLKNSSGAEPSLALDCRVHSAHSLEANLLSWDHLLTEEERGVRALTKEWVNKKFPDWVMQVRNWQ